MTRIWDRIRDWVVLFVLLVASIGVMLAQNEPIVRTLRATALDTTAWVESQFAWAGGFFRALDENRFLREENIQLASEVARSREAMYENERLRSMIAFVDSSEYDLLPARIVSKDLTRQQNFLTLDVGRRDGVEEGMAVVDERGVIGRVELVSENYARVMPYLNVDFRIPARVQEIRSEGIVRWEGNRYDHILMEHVVKTDPVEPGHLVIVSGYSTTFPEGYPIGVVDSVAVRTGRNERYVYIRPAAPLDKTSFAFVILQQPDQELQELDRQQLRP